MLKTVIIFSFLLSASSQALAKTMTAVCGPFKGYTVGLCPHSRFVCCTVMVSFRGNVT